MKRRVLQTTTGLFSLALLAGVWGLAPVSLDDRAVLLEILGALGTILLVSIAYYHTLRTWRGFWMILLLHILAQIWLQWQGDLWGSTSQWIYNLNQVALFVVWTTLALLLVSLSLLLVFRDASGVALAIAWLGWPVLLIGTAAHFGTLARLDSASIREVPVLYSAACLLSCLVPMGVVAFVGHFLWLLIQEFAGRELGLRNQTNPR